MNRAFEATLTLSLPSAARIGRNRGRTVNYSVSILMLLPSPIVRAIMCTRENGLSEAESDKPWPAKSGPAAAQAPARPSLRAVPRAEAGPSQPAKPQAVLVTFDRHELRIILNLYGRMVAAGEWRDYAIDFSQSRAVFSVFRRASEAPLFRIEKDPKLARKQGAWSVVAAGGLIVKRGQDLARVIEVLDRRAKLTLV